MNSRVTRLAPQSSVASPHSVDLFDGARFGSKRFVGKTRASGRHDPTPPRATKPKRRPLPGKARTRPWHCHWLCPSRHPRATRSGRRCRKRRRRGRCLSRSNLSHLSSRPSRDIRRCRWACSTSSRCGFRAARRLCLRVRPRRCRRRRASCRSSNCSRLARARCRARSQAHRPHRAQDHCPAHCQARSPHRAAQRPPVARRGPLMSLRRAASHLAMSSHASL